MINAWVFRIKYSRLAFDLLFIHFSSPSSNEKHTLNSSMNNLNNTSNWLQLVFLAGRRETLGTRLLLLLLFVIIYYSVSSRRYSVGDAILKVTHRVYKKLKCVPHLVELCWKHQKLLKVYRLRSILWVSLKKNFCYGSKHVACDWKKWHYQQQQKISSGFGMDNILSMASVTALNK